MTLLTLLPSNVIFEIVTSDPFVVPIPTQLPLTSKLFPAPSFKSLPKYCFLIIVFFPLPWSVNPVGIINLFVRYVPPLNVSVFPPLAIRVSITDEKAKVLSWTIFTALSEFKL